jgi:3-methyladenine DNA glycosylase AlkC
MEPFKNLIDRTLVRHAGEALERSDPGFDRARFQRLALRGMDALELKARAMQVADALESTLPSDFDRACNVIEAALAPPIAVIGEQAQPRDAADGLAGWVVWPLGEFVARRGIAAPERALQALHALTQRLTAEFAIRPLIVAHPQLVLDRLLQWTRDPSAHVRRLASEGSRPRLPWGLRLQALVADPTPTLPILAALQDDPSPYVRRSVANHLNDIAKDHPVIVVDWVRRHLPDATPERRTLLRHASRTLIKQGHGAMLALWDAGTPFEGRCTLQIAPRRVAIGEAVQITLALRSTSTLPQSLLVDYTVHHANARGGSNAKVFKGWRVTLEPGQALTLTKQHSFKPVTTRRYHPGDQAFDVTINGAVAARGSVRLALSR